MADLALHAISHALSALLHLSVNFVLFTGTVVLIWALQAIRRSERE